MTLAAGIAAAAAGAACGWPASALIPPYIRPPEAAGDEREGTGSQAAWLARIPAPVLAGGAAVILAGLAAAAGLRLHPLAVAVAGSWLAVCGLPLSVIDVCVRRLPDRLTGAAFAGVAAALLAAAAAMGNWGQLGRAAAGGAGIFAVFAGLAFLWPASAGLGDAKLSLSTGVLAAWCGWGILLASVFVGLALAAICGLALLVARRATLRSGSLPFGPFLLAGCLAVVLTAGPSVHG